jgi:RNase H-fold protein (predicted Holliday junction resolvase)
MVMHCTLGISCNTRLIGMAVFSGNSLIDYSTKLNKEKWSETKAQKIITSLLSCCQNFNIQSIALSIPHAFQQTKTMDSLVQKIITALRGRDVSITTYPIHEVVSRLKLPKKTKKKAFQQTLTEIYPEIGSMCLDERTSKSRYYDKVLEAIGVGLVHVLRTNNV